MIHLILRYEFGILEFRITLALDAYGVAINYTSATIGAAAFNCVPVTTFFFAVLLRSFFNPYNHLIKSTVFLLF